MDEAEALLKRAEAGPLSHEDVEILRGLIETLYFLGQAVDQKSQSIGRLLKMFFGSQNEKSREILEGSALGHDDATHQNNDTPDDSPETQDTSGTQDPPQKKRTTPGHGRNGVKQYTGAESIHVDCHDVKSGELCPKCARGKTYPIAPRTLVRVSAEAPISAKVIELGQLRCNTCGEVFTAESPAGVGMEKYDSKSIAMIALLHYGTGMPFNRLDNLQKSLGVPLPASTQWDIVEQGSDPFAHAFEHLADEAAQGQLIHNDDTPAKILDLMGKRANGKPPDPEKAHRRGLFTTGIISKLEDRKMALFRTGSFHAGENLGDLLARRKLDLAPPIQMCDGLEHNIPREFKTILANCTAHSRRKFVEILNHFPNECRHVILELAQVYHHDAIAREENMNDCQRLAFHQAKSEGIMSELKEWMMAKLQNKEVEPNSGLGQAINYSLKRWESLTLFLRKPGAPLDNNICERALKKSILTRKNSLFFRSKAGARVADIYMSFIHTCELGKINPFEYLTAILDNREAVREAPERWMPWNFQEALVVSKS